MWKFNIWYNRCLEDENALEEKFLKASKFKGVNEQKAL